jgi:hypothetical protein
LAQQAPIIRREATLTDTYARRLFSIAAGYNFIMSAPAVIAATPAGRLLGMAPPTDPMNAHLALVLVLTFGWGYWRISRDPVANRSIIVLGMVGKSLVALAGWTDWATGHANTFFGLAVTGDAIFAALFFDYLRRTAPAKQAV